MVPSSNDVDFQGIPFPEGVERRMLYHSSYRAIATYAMPLADLEWRSLPTLRLPMRSSGQACLECMAGG